MLEPTHTVLPAKRSKRSKLNNQRNKILTQLEQGKTQREIAKNLGVHNSSISRWLDTIDQEKQQISRFRSSRADVLSQLQSQAVSLQLNLIADLEEDRLRNALSPQQKSGLLHTLTVVSGTAFDKERIETGQSTHNISVVSRMIDQQVSTLYTRKQKPLDNPAPASQPIDARPALIIDSPVTD